MFKATVNISLKSGVLDPQGKTVEHALHSLGFAQVEDIRMGKYINVTLNCDDINEAKEQLNQMCEKLLANPVIEDYHFDIKEI